MGARVIQGNVFDVLPTLPRGSVDAVCTSPPYWMLRSYLPKGHALKSLELGSEPTPTEYVANMVRVLRLVRDVMADHAVAFVNVGDTYSGGGASRHGLGGSGLKRNVKDEETRLRCCAENKTFRDDTAGVRVAGIPSGSLCLIPQRLAIALQDDGWIVRSVIVWHKPACMPASLAGWMWKRCRVKVGAGGGRLTPKQKLAHKEGIHDASSTGLHTPGWRNGETRAAQWADCPGCPKCEPHDGYVLRRGSWRPTSSWEPVLMLAKRQGYYSDGEAVKQPDSGNRNPRPFGKSGNGDRKDGDSVFDGGDGTANLRDVWTIASEPLREAHYAAFPTELVHRCLKSATSARGYCPACGKPWARVVETTGGDAEAHQRPKRTGGMDSGSSTLSLSGNGSKEWAERGTQSRTLGWRQTCACPPAEPRPGLVLDPFAGSGRVGIECLRLGLDFVGCELNPEYAAMATRLFREESPLFAGVE